MNFLRRVFGIVLAMVTAQVMSTSYPDVADVQRFIQEHPRSVILFHIQGCPYCAHVRPLFDAVREKYANRPDLTITFLSVNVAADAYNFRDIFNFSTVPMFIYIKDGIEQVQYRHGSDNKKLQQSTLEALIQAIYS